MRRRRESERPFKSKWLVTAEGRKRASLVYAKEFHFPVRPTNQPAAGGGDCSRKLHAYSVGRIMSEPFCVHQLVWLFHARYCSPSLPPPSFLPSFQLSQYTLVKRTTTSEKEGTSYEGEMKTTYSEMGPRARLPHLTLFKGAGRFGFAFGSCSAHPSALMLYRPTPTGNHSRLAAAAAAAAQLMKHHSGLKMGPMVAS
jgi:hypothetical protein